MANIVMTTHWTGGDVYPFIRIGGALTERYGHKVTLLTHCYYEDKARRAGLEFAPFDTPEEWAAFLVDDAKIGNPLSNLQGVLEFRTKYQNEQRYLHEYEKLKRHCLTSDTVLFVRHVDSVGALLLAEKLRIPIVTVYMAPSFLSQVFNDNEIFGNELAGTLNAVRSELELPAARSWLAWWNAPKRTVGLWPSWFDTIGTASAQAVTPVGFALDNTNNNDLLPAEVGNFLSEHERPILISGGTGKQLKAGFYDVCADACRSLGRPALLVTQHEELVPKDLPENIRWFKYLPLAPLMPRMGAIMHHGGINTCAEALAAGIPQMILGFYYDRPGNGMRLKKLGVAEYFPPVGWRPDIVAEALSRLMVNATIERCGQLAQRMRAEDVMANINAVIEDAVGNEKLVIDSSEFVDNGKNDSRADQRERSIGIEKQQALNRVKELSPERRTLLAQMLREKQRTA